MVKLTKEEVELRQYITRGFLALGYAPDKSAMSLSLNKSLEQIETILKSLAANKALVLHPHKTEVWLTHPFSNSPSLFWVQGLKSKKGWWSNCTWCAMGVASLAKENVKIISRWGGEGKSFEVEVRDGVLTKTDFVVHMATPVAEMWDNVMHTCSLMLPYKNEEQLDEWCECHNIKKGVAMPATKCFELAKKWYGPCLDQNWNRMSPEEVKNFFNCRSLDLI